MPAQSGLRQLVTRSSVAMNDFGKRLPVHSVICAGAEQVIHMRYFVTVPIAALSAAIPAGCSSLSGETATVPIAQGYGPKPVLPEPNPTTIPTINIAPAKGWAEGATPKAASGLSVSEFAGGLDHPRWLHVLPNGDVLVAETNRPPKREGGFSLRGIVQSAAQKTAGAATKSANRISLLRDADGDGRAETQNCLSARTEFPFRHDARRQHALRGQYRRNHGFPLFSRTDQDRRRAVSEIADLPAEPINHHWTKDVIASRDGRGFMPPSDPTAMSARRAWRLR